MSAPATKTVYLLKAGDQLGVYRVVRPLGAGGMGEVYLVEHQHLRKRYALKILPSDVSMDSSFIDRFRIEARVMADLEHPGIVRVHNFGEDKDHHYLVMDYVEGPDGAPRTLDDELAWGAKLPENVVVNLAIQLCDAMEYAHTFPAGAIIHRDLKPGNILIYKPEQKSGPAPATPPAGPEPELRVKIADFGLAKIVGTDYVRAVIDRSTRLTALPVRNLSADAEATEINTAGGSTVSLLGTYDYMSPEQKTGAAVDARSDLYALGLILYRMLTGHKPEGTYDPPSKTGVSRRWDPILARCLKRILEERYQSAAQLKKDIESLRMPVHRRIPLLAIVAIAASVCTALLVLALRRPAAPAVVAEPVEELTAAPGELLLPFTVETKPAGATVTVLRGRETVVEPLATGRSGAALKLRPGVYTFRVELAGHRTYEQDVAVGDDQPKRLRVALEESFGYLHLLEADGMVVAFLDPTGKQVSPGAPERMGSKQVFRLPAGRYEAMFSKTDHAPVSRTVDIREDVPNELTIKLAPLPGSLFVNSTLTAEIWESGRLVGRTGEWIRKTPAGVRTLELRRAGYRAASLAAQVPPNGEVQVDAPILEEQQAELHVQVEISGRTVPPEHHPTRGRLKIDGADTQDVTLPWTGILRELDKALALALQVDGYDVSKAETVTLKDRDKRTVTFRLLPHPVQFTIQCNVPAQVYRLRDGQFAQGWRKTVFGRDVPVGKTGEPIILDAFVPQKLTVVAEGHRPETIEVHPLRPGATDETRTVTLTTETKE
ncbi:MAG TPA: protein kinase [Kiritimatiellia bacterium]|nr:protein kinase [Kiritimatiellia bacterium]